MIPSVRIIKENRNVELQKNTEQEIQGLMRKYHLHPVEKVIEAMDDCLENRTENYIKKIQSILDKSYEEIYLSYELRVLKKIFFSPLFSGTTFERLNSSMEMFKLYQKCFLLLKRIEFGFIEDKNTYLKMACEEYNIKPTDFSFVLDLERV